jgi:hypothetical protein
VDRCGGKWSDTNTDPKQIRCLGTGVLRRNKTEEEIGGRKILESEVVHNPWSTSHLELNLS